MKALLFLTLIPFASFAQKAQYAHECEVIMVGESSCGLLKSRDGNNIYSLIAPATEEGQLHFVEDKEEIEDTDESPTEERKKFRKQLKQSSEVSKNLLVACGPSYCRSDMVAAYNHKLGLKKKSMRESKFNAQFLGLQRNVLEEINTELEVISYSSLEAFHQELQGEKILRTKELYGKKFSSEQLKGMKEELRSLLEKMKEQDKTDFKQVKEIQAMSYQTIDDIFKKNPELKDLFKEIVTARRTKDSSCHVGWTHSNPGKSYRAESDPIVSIIPNKAESVILEMRVDSETRKCELSDMSKVSLKNYGVEFDVEQICKNINAKCPEPKKISGEVRATYELMQNITVHNSIEEATVKGGDSIMLAQTDQNIFLYRSQCDDSRTGTPIYTVSTLNGMNHVKKVHQEHNDRRVASKDPTVMLKCIGGNEDPVITKDPKDQSNQNNQTRKKKTSRK